MTRSRRQGVGKGPAIRKGGGTRPTPPFGPPADRELRATHPPGRRRSQAVKVRAKRV